MKTAEDWNWEHTQICASDPAVHGHLLPTPQMVRFIKRIQVDMLMHAADVCLNDDGLSILAAGKLNREAQELSANAAQP